MFETLQALVNKLQEAYNTTAKVSRENRKVLQSIKVEAQALRNKITSDLKTAPKVRKEKIDKIQGIKPVSGIVGLEEVEEPKEVIEPVVEDDDFFDKQ